MNNISDYIGWKKNKKEGIIAGLILGSFFFMFSFASIIIVGMLAVIVIITGIVIGIVIAIKTKNPGNVYWAIAPMGTVLAYLMLMVTSGVI